MIFLQFRFNSSFETILFIYLSTNLRWTFPAALMFTLSVITMIGKSLSILQSNPGKKFMIESTANKESLIEKFVIFYFYILCESQMFCNKCKKKSY